MTAATQDQSICVGAVAVYRPRVPGQNHTSRFQPQPGDILEVERIHRNPRWGGADVLMVPFLDADVWCLAQVNACDVEPATIDTGERLFHIIRRRMSEWLDDRNRWMSDMGLELGLYSKTSMAHDVVPWRGIGDSYAICEAAGWP